ncbi:MAG: sensor histidine kinase, partial [bacterium]
MSTLLVIFLAVVAVVSIFSLMTASNNRNAVRDGLAVKAATTADFFAGYITRTQVEYYDSAYLYIENFDDASRLDLQFIDTNGRIIISSYSMTAGTTPGTGDITAALTEGRVADWEGYNPATGEHIMAVSAPMRYSGGQVIGVMRYVTSLRLVDRQ